MIPEHRWKPPLPPSNNFTKGYLEKGSSLHAACWYAANIHLNSLKRGIPFSSDENQVLLEKLRSCITVFPKNDDVELEGEIYIWLCFTGAAAAKINKTWFLAKIGPTVMSLSQKQLCDFKKGVNRFAYIVQKLNNIIT